MVHRISARALAPEPAHTQKLALLGLLAALAPGCADGDTMPPAERDTGTDNVQGEDAALDAEQVPVESSDAGPSRDASLLDGALTAVDAELDGALSCGSCPAATPVCVEGQCVECDGQGRAQCAEDALCEPSSHTCKKAVPFELDCAHLPPAPSGGCQAGPREVLLATHRTGAIAMFDPADGHFLGYLKHGEVPYSGGQGGYQVASQGPDQCIWTAMTGSRAVQRWNTDGTFKDNVIPEGKHYEGSSDIVEQSTALAFSADRAYVAFANGNPNPRIVSFDMAGKLDRVVLDNGVIPESLIVLSDGSLVVSDSNLDRIAFLPKGGAEPVPLAGSIAPGPLFYAGDRKIMAVDRSANKEAYLLSLDTGMATKVKPFSDYTTYLEGAALLDNGKWLVTGESLNVSVLDPASSNPTGQNELVFDSISEREPDMFNALGRACLPAAFVEEQSKPDPEPSSCAAPDGPTLLSENFETGDFTGEGLQRQLRGFFDVDDPGSTVSIAAGTRDGAPTRSLQVYSAGVKDFHTGARYEFAAPIQPKYIGYYVMVDDIQRGVGHVSLRDEGASDNDFLDMIFFRYQTLRSEATRASQSALDAQGVARINTWIRIQLRDIDWTRRTYDLYVDCKRVGDDLPFAPDTGSHLKRLDFFNFYTHVNAWFDDVVVK